MASPQVGIFRQGTRFHWFQRFRVDAGAPEDGVRRAIDAVGGLVREAPSWIHRDSRDLTGFVDGTANPDVEEARSIVVLPDGSPGAGGSFVFASRWVHDLDGFHARPLADQEAVFGRTKADSVEIEDRPPDAHISRVEVHKNGEELEIYRRSVPMAPAPRRD